MGACTARAIAPICGRWMTRTSVSCSRWSPPPACWRTFVYLLKGRTTWPEAERRCVGPTVWCTQPQPTRPNSTSVTWWMSCGRERCPPSMAEEVQRFALLRGSGLGGTCAPPVYRRQWCAPRVRNGSPGSSPSRGSQHLFQVGYPCSQSKKKERMTTTTG